MELRTRNRRWKLGGSKEAAAAKRRRLRDLMQAAPIVGEEAKPIVDEEPVVDLDGKIISKL